MPHPAKPDTPSTRVFSYRVPVDEADAHEVSRVEAAKFLGTHERPYWQYWTYTYAFGAVFQDESLRGVGQRGALS